MTLKTAPIRAAFTVLGLHGFDLREVWLGDYFDGLMAVKMVNGQRVEIWAGNADDGDDDGDNFYAPVVYIGNRVELHADSLSELAQLATRAALPEPEIVKLDGGTYGLDQTVAKAFKAAELRQAAALDTSCVGAFARARP